MKNRNAFRLVLMIAAFCFCLAIFAVYQLRQSTPKSKVGSDQPYPIIVLGDSLVEGQGASSPQYTFTNQLLLKLKPAYPQASLTALGKRGSTLDDVLQTQVLQMINKPAKLVIVVVGTNDITTTQTTSDHFAAGLSSLINGLVQPGRQVLILNIPHFSLTPLVPDSLRSLADRRTQEFNDLILKAAKGHSSVKVFDFYTLSGQKLLTVPNLISSDNFHPNDHGYQLMAEAVANFLLQK